MSSQNAVQQFYANKSVFITGGSGFMGKCLVEKLLYSCDDIKEVIILIRPKRNKTAKQRIEDFANLACFGRIMREKPEVMNKIFPVFGDATKLNFDMSEEHLNKVLDSTEIVFHLAASLKLEATLKPNILANLTATKYAIDVAKRMKNLIQFLYTSTAYCCEDQKILEERVYDFHHDPNDLIRCAEWMTENAMSAMQKEILGSQPNTYTYTKRLSEILIRNEYGKLPVCIVRPSIVAPAFKEPCPGWVDSLNGPPGIMLAASKGVLRSMLMNPENKIEAIPVDACTHGMIHITKHLATTPRPAEIPVYNMTLHESRKITLGKMIEHSRTLSAKYPSYGGLWYPDGDITQNAFVHTLKVFLFQWIPAYFIDFILFCFRQKTFMVHVQKRIAVGLEVLTFFTMREWNFKSDKFEALAKSQTENERKVFDFDTSEQGDEYEYLKNSVLGARQYCVKDPLSTLPKARLQLKIQYCVHVFCKAVFWYYLISFVLKVSGLREPVWNAFGYLTASLRGH